ncbi:MAG: C45 family autoproteolytic acyltransferase/hydrolase [Steroidobacteraceae bacterium]
MELHFEALAEDQPGARWQHWFHTLWPAYRAWYLAAGNAARPTYLECERAMHTYLPKFVPTWERLTDLAGGGDLEARFLSLYCPPPYLTGCSQAAWVYPAPMLVRNYDYSPFLCEKLIWRTAWNGRAVIAASDCMVGALDGINDAGLSVSLSFGGRKDSGVGFGAPMIVRYVLEFCNTVAEAAETLRRIPVNMAYNILLLDAFGNYMTAYTSPDGPTILRRISVNTNHQDRVRWARHAEATDTLERERRLHELQANRALYPADIVNQFLLPPLYQTKYRRGWGTLYTAVYHPLSHVAEFIWPDMRWTQHIDNFQEARHILNVNWGESPSDIVLNGANF